MRRLFFTIFSLCALLTMTFFLPTAHAATGYSGDVSPATDPGTWTSSATPIIGGATAGGVGSIFCNGGSSVTNGNCFVGEFPYPGPAGTGTASIDGSGSTWTNTGTLYVGYGAAGTLDITNGSSVSVAATTWVGDLYSYSVLGAGAINFGASGGTLTTQALCASPGQLTGTGTINANGLVTDTNLSFPNPASLTQNGLSGFGTVAVNLNMSTPANNGYLGVGYSSSGTLTIQTPITSTNGYLGFLPGSTGTATVSGSGVWTMSAGGSANIGGYGTGTLNIVNGGQVSVGVANLGTTAGNGTVNVNGSGSKLTLDSSGNSASNIGDHSNSLVPNASGTLNITNGGSVVGKGAYLGTFAGGAGYVTVAGSGSTWTNTAGIYVGNIGSGTMTITNGGVASGILGADGFDAGATGSVTVSGANSKWTNSSTLYVGNSGTGTLSILNGGAVSNTTGVVGSNSAGIGTVSIDGSGSTWTSSSTLTIANAGTAALYISGGGAATTTSNVSVGANGLLEVDVGRSSLLQADNGTGTLTNNGNVRVVAGADVPASNIYTPISAGTWSGTGTCQPVGGTWNTVTQQFTASTVASSSGMGGATASIDTSLLQRMLISNTTGGTSLGASFPATTSSTRIDLTATTLTGAPLSSLQGDLPVGQAVLDGWGISTTGYSAGSPAYLSFLIGAGYTPYQLATAAFSRDNLSVWDYNGTTWSPFQANDLTFDGTYASFSVTALSGYDYAVVGTPLQLGDANRDGRVDVNDLTIVLTNFGQSRGMSWSTGDFTGDGTVDVNDLTIVLSNFGETAGSSAAGMVPVPEPSTIALLLAFAACLLAYAWRRRC